MVLSNVLRAARPFLWRGVGMIWDLKFAEALLDAPMPPAADSLFGRALRLYIKAQFGPHLEILLEAWEELPLKRRVELRLGVAEKRQVEREEEAGTARPYLDRLQTEHDAVTRKKEEAKR